MLHIRWPQTLSPDPVPHWGAYDASRPPSRPGKGKDEVKEKGIGKGREFKNLLHGNISTSAHHVNNLSR